MYTLYKNNSPHLISFLRRPKKIPYETPYNEGGMWAIERNYSLIMNDSFYLTSLLLREYSRQVTIINATFIRCSQLACVTG